MKRQPSINPLGPVVLALAAVAVLGALYWGFGIGKDALTYAIAALAVMSFPVVVIFGVTGIVLGVRRLWKGRKP